MIVAVVTIPLPGGKRPHKEVIDQSVAATPLFRDVPGLRRKYFLNHESGGAGVYEFATRADAEAWFDEGWADWMEGRFGVRPQLTMYDNPVVLDNEAGEVRVEGRAISPPAADDAARRRA